MSALSSDLFMTIPIPCPSAKKEYLKSNMYTYLHFTIIQNTLCIQIKVWVYI